MQLHPQNPGFGGLPPKMYDPQQVVALTMVGDRAQRFQRAMKGQKTKAVMNSKVVTSADRQLLFWRVGERRWASSGRRRW